MSIARATSPVGRVSNPPSPRRSPRTALQLFYAKSSPRIPAVLREDLVRFLHLFDRQPRDGYGVRILPAKYVRDVCGIRATRLRDVLHAAQRLKLLKAVVIETGERSDGEPEAYVVGVDGAPVDILFNAMLLITNLRAAHERCYSSPIVKHGHLEDLRA